MPITHYTAWLAVTRPTLDQDNIDVMVLEDEATGETETGSPVWACKGEAPAFTGVTNVPAGDGDHKRAQDEARELLAGAGWTTVGAWDAVDTGYVVTVERS